MSESSVAAETIPFELVNRTELISLQQCDTSLSSLFELADKGDDRYFIKSFFSELGMISSPGQNAVDLRLWSLLLCD